MLWLGLPRGETSGPVRWRMTNGTCWRAANCQRPGHVTSPGGRACCTSKLDRGFDGQPSARPDGGRVGAFPSWVRCGPRAPSRRPRAVTEADLGERWGWCYWPAVAFRSAIWARAAVTSSAMVFGWPLRPPVGLGGLGQQHPGTVDQGGVAGRLGDDVGELAHHRELLVPVRFAGVAPTSPALSLK
jgi:hypothetical protein